MRILGVDSSGMVASVALVEDDLLVAEYSVNYKKTHSQTLLPMLDEIVKMTELDLNTIDAIAVAAGPGSFTGLRIGAATVKGLGLALEKPVISVPTCHGLAYNLWGSDKLICPIMDARRSQVYTGIYEFMKDGMQVLLDQSAMDIRALAEKLNAMGREVIFLGDGCPVYASVLAECMQVPYAFAPAHLNRQRASAVASLGAEYFKQGKQEPADDLIPIYLRKSQAEREREEKLAAEGQASNAYAQRVAQMEQDAFDDAWTEAMVADSLAQSYNHLWLAEDDAGTPCGYLLANVLGDETELLRIAVNPECRKDGIGQLLMDAYLAFARIDAVRGLLEVRHGNGAAKHLYEKNGYHLLACRKNYYKHPDEDADIYEIAFTENGE